MVNGFGLTLSNRPEALTQPSTSSILEAGVFANENINLSEDGKVHMRGGSGRLNIEQEEDEQAGAVSKAKEELEEEIRKAHETLYKQGLEMRKKVVGEEYVERTLKAASDDFGKVWQDHATVGFILSFHLFVLHSFSSFSELI